MGAVVLYRIDPSRNMQRYYRLEVQPDLFGVWLLVCEWGRIGRSGQMRIVSFSSPGEAQLALERRRRAKQGRGYVAEGTGTGDSWRSR